MSHDQRLRNRSSETIGCPRWTDRPQALALVDARYSSTVTLAASGSRHRLLLAESLLCQIVLRLAADPERGVAATQPVRRQRHRWRDARATIQQPRQRLPVQPSFDAAAAVRPSPGATRRLSPGREGLYIFAIIHHPPFGVQVRQYRRSGAIHPPSAAGSIGSATSAYPTCNRGAGEQRNGSGHGLSRGHASGTAFDDDLPYRSPLHVDDKRDHECGPDYRWKDLAVRAPSPQHRTRERRDHRAVRADHLDEMLVEPERLESPCRKKAMRATSYSDSSTSVPSVE